MAEGNGDMHEDIVNLRVDERADSERTEDYVKLLEYGLDRKVTNNFIYLNQSNVYFDIRLPVN